MEINDWNQEGLFYIIDINGKTKFGITVDWSRRLKMYEKEFLDLPIILSKTDSYQNYWKAHLVEQVLKWRLRRFIVPGLHEWVIGQFPIISVIDCYNETKSILAKEYDLHEHIHHKGNDRFGYYKQLAKLLFPNGIG